MTGIVLPLSILTAFITPRVSKAKLEQFYKRVRPGGFWGVLDAKILNLPGKAISMSTILDVVGGLMLCYGLSLAIGYGILLNFTKAGICLLMALVGGLIVYRWYVKEVKTLKAFGSSDEDEI